MIIEKIQSRIKEESAEMSEIPIKKRRLKMNVIDATKRRRSIRKFQNRPIERSIILELIRSAGLCQSAKNRQPWRFMILEGENKDHIAEIMCQNFSQTDIPLTGYMNSAKSSAAIIRNAPVVLAIFKEKALN